MEELSKSESGKHKKREFITYYKCKKPRYIRTNCPQLKKKEKVLIKAMKVTWDKELSSESKDSD